MNRTKKALVTVLVAAGISAGAAATAHAATVSAGGGTWNYGVTGSVLSGTSYSHYYHGTRCHGATAVGRTTVRTPDTRAGLWARADAPRAISNNQAYWRNSC